MTVMKHLPFILNLPKSMQLRIVETTPFMMVDFEDGDLKFNLAWSPYNGPPTLPDGYSLFDFFVIKSSGGELECIIGNLDPKLIIKRILVQGFILGGISFFFLSLMPFISFFLAAIITFILIGFLSFISYKTQASILKYIFTYEGIEYVFSVKEDGIEAFEKILSSMQFKSY